MLCAHICNCGGSNDWGPVFDQWSQKLIKKMFLPTYSLGRQSSEIFHELFGKSLWMEEQLSFPSLFCVLNLLSSSLRLHS